MQGLASASVLPRTTRRTAGLQHLIVKDIELTSDTLPSSTVTSNMP